MKKRKKKMRKTQHCLPLRALLRHPGRFHTILSKKICPKCGNHRRHPSSGPFITRPINLICPDEPYEFASEPHKPSLGACCTPDGRRSALPLASLSFGAPLLGLLWLAFFLICCFATMELWAFCLYAGVFRALSLTSLRIL